MKAKEGFFLPNSAVLSFMEEVECKVTGRVQMVMYRDFAKRKAEALGLTGEVENRQDGSVRVLAQGEKKKLGVFIQKLRRGPLFAHVEQIETIWRSPTKTFQTFELLR